MSRRAPRGHPAVFALASAACLLQDASVDVRPGSDDDVAEQIDRYLGRAVPFGFSGQCVVEKDGEVILEGSYGWADRDSAVPVASDTAFGAASMTKPFVAAAILLLQERGELNTGDAIEDHLEDPPEGKRGIRIHQLLTHTSGIPYTVSADDWQIAEPAEVLATIYEAPLATSPGSEWRDSGRASPSWWQSSSASRVRRMKTSSGNIDSSPLG